MSYCLFYYIRTQYSYVRCTHQVCAFCSLLFFRFKINLICGKSCLTLSDIYRVFIELWIVKAVLFINCTNLCQYLYSFTFDVRTTRAHINFYKEWLLLMTHWNFLLRYWLWSEGILTAYLLERTRSWSDHNPYDFDNQLRQSIEREDKFIAHMSCSALRSSIFTGTSPLVRFGCDVQRLS